MSSKSQKGFKNLYFKSIWSKDFLNGYHSLPAFYRLKVNNESTRIRCEIYSKLTVKTPK